MNLIGYTLIVSIILSVIQFIDILRPQYRQKLAEFEPRELFKIKVNTKTAFTKFLIFTVVTPVTILWVTNIDYHDRMDIFLHAFALFCLVNLGAMSARFYLSHKYILNEIKLREQLVRK